MHFRLLKSFFRGRAWAPWLFWLEPKFENKSHHHKHHKEKRGGKRRHHHANAGLLLKDNVDLPDLLYYMPPSIYSSCIMAPILLPSKSWLDFFNTRVFPYVLLALNYYVQYTFIFLVAAPAMDNNFACTLDIMMLTGCIFAFTCSILMDVQDTGDLFYVVTNQIPTVPVTSPLIFIQEDGELKLKGGENSGGFSIFRKVLLLLTVVLPKLICGISLLVAGCMYLIYSDSNTEIVLNCLALVFIVEVDEIIYDFLIMPKVHRLIESMPPFKSPVPYRLWKHISTPFKFFVIVAIVFFFVQWFEESCLS